MKVKQLIEALKNCDPEALVCVEANSDPVATKVVQYTLKKDSSVDVYICDTEEYLDEVMQPHRKRVVYKEG